MSRRYRIWKYKEKGAAHWGIYSRPKPTLKAYKKHKRELERAKKYRWNFPTDRSMLIKIMRTYGVKDHMHILYNAAKEKLAEMKRRKG